MIRKLLFFLVLNVYAQPISPNTISYISSLFKTFKRPFTVLDLLNDGGQTAQQLIDQCNGCYVLMQHGAVWQKDIPPNLIMLDYAWNYKTLRLLETCEDFDVILVNTTAPEIHATRLEIIKLCSTMALITIWIHNEKIKTPIFSKRIRAHNDQMVALMRKERILKHAFLYDPQRRNYTITSTIHKKMLHKKGKIINWIAGINLCTFVSLHGIIPTQQHLVDELYQQFSLANEDPKAANVIVCGSTIHFIDTTLDSRWTFDKGYAARLKRFGAIFNLMKVKPAGIDYQRLSKEDYALLKKHAKAVLLRQVGRPEKKKCSLKK